MNEISELIKAISSLLWPLVTFCGLLIFRRPIADAIHRLEKGKILGQELEMSDSLIKLQQSASNLSNEIASIPPSSSSLEDSQSNTIEESDNTVDSVIHETSRSPKAALILLATELEREARQILASIGLLKGRKHVPISRAIEELDKHYGLPNHVSSSLKFFWEARNKIIHGGSAEEKDILSAIDSGLTILRSLLSLPRETNIVLDPKVDIFHDQECKNMISDAKGILLKTSSPGRSKTSLRIFPSTKTHFEKGKSVAWEWDLSKQWGEAWFNNPKTGKVELAWSSSGEFIGRHLDEV